MPRRVSSLALALFMAVPLVAQEAGPPADVPVVQPGDMRVEELAALWTKVTGTPVTVDPQAGQVVIRFGTETRLEREVLRTLLGFNDVVVVEDASGGLQLHHRRNVPQKVPPTSPVIGGQAPEGDQMVTAVHYLRHGAGHEIFATLRGIMTRDMNRIGNILYVPGSEALVIADLAPQVRYYQALLEKLDVARPVIGLSLRVLELPRARWRELAAGAQGAALAKALAAEPGAVELESADLDLAGESFKLQREHRLASGVRQVHLEVGPLPPPPNVAAPQVVLRSEGAHLVANVNIHGETDALQRHLELTIPTLSAEEVTLVQAFAGQEGAQPTQLVLVLTTRPRG